MQKGYLMLAYTPGQLEQFVANRDLQRCIDPDNLTVILSPDEIAALNPYLHLEGVVGGSFNPRDGHANPWHVTQAYAEAAARLGVEIVRFTEVVGIDLDRGRIARVRTTRGDISTPTVVNCAGAARAPGGRDGGSRDTPGTAAPPDPGHRAGGADLPHDGHLVPARHVLQADAARRAC